MKIKTHCPYAINDTTCQHCGNHNHLCEHQSETDILYPEVSGTIEELEDRLVELRSARWRMESEETPYTTPSQYRDAANLAEEIQKHERSIEFLQRAAMVYNDEAGIKAQHKP